MQSDRLPQPGLDTSGLEGDTCVDAVRTALEAGYRHVDTAQRYDNERAVGEAIAGSEVDREDVFLATKIDPRNLAYEDVLETTEESLERLGVDAVDLLYVHWPTEAYDPEETLPAFDEARDRGLTRHVGVCNFTVELLEEAIDALESPAFANRIELHPWLQQNELVSFARERDIWTVAHTPIMQGHVVDIGVMQSIAGNHGATPSQVTLAWHYGRDGVVPVPEAVGGHFREHYSALDIELTADERRQIADLDRGYRFVDPDDAPWNR